MTEKTPMQTSAECQMHLAIRSIELSLYADTENVLMERNLVTTPQK